MGHIGVESQKPGGKMLPLHMNPLWASKNYFPLTRTSVIPGVSTAHMNVAASTEALEQVLDSEPT